MYIRTYIYIMGDGADGARRRRRVHVFFGMECGGPYRRRGRAVDYINVVMINLELEETFINYNEYSMHI